MSTLVSAHAALKWLVRVEKFDLRPIVRRLGRDAGNGALLEAAARALGVSPAEIRRRVLPAELEPLVKTGAARIHREGFVLACQGGVVATVLTRVHNRGYRIFSERELKRHRQRQDRRRR